MWISQISSIYHVYTLVIAICFKYTWNIPSLALRLFIFTAWRPGGWCRRSGTVPAAPEPPTMVSVGRVSSTMVRRPMPAALHTGVLPMCAFPDFSVGNVVKNMPLSSHLAQTNRVVWVIKKLAAAIHTRLWSTIVRVQDCVSGTCMPRGQFWN